MFFKRSFRFFLPRIMTSFRYKLSRPTLTGPNRLNSSRRISVFSPFMSIGLGLGLLAVGSSKDSLRPSSLADVYEKCSRSVVHLRLEIKTDDEVHRGKNMISNGSGFVIREDGLILTNAHVVYDMSIKSKLTIRFYDGRVVKGQVICIDPLSDLALVKPSEGTFSSSQYPPVKFKFIDNNQIESTKTTVSNNLRVGDSIFAVGSPFGLLNTMSAGIVSGLHRRNQEMNKTFAFNRDSRINYLQTDLHLSPGNSGGPIFDGSGQVVGISTVRSETEGISFAIQANTSLRKILDQMISEGKVRRAWLGFRGVSLNPEILEQIDDNTTQQSDLHGIKHGVLVLKSYDKSPAIEADLRSGDVVVAVNGQPVKDISELSAFLDDQPFGQSTNLQVKRIVLSKNPSIPNRVISINCTIKPDEYDIFNSKSTPYN